MLLRCVPLRLALRRWRVQRACSGRLVRCCALPLRKAVWLLALSQALPLRLALRAVQRHGLSDLVRGCVVPLREAWWLLVLSRALPQRFLLTVQRHRMGELRQDWWLLVRSRDLPLFSRRRNRVRLALGQ